MSVEMLELQKFRTLYLTFAETILEIVEKQYMSASSKTILAQDFQFSGDQYTTLMRPVTAQERFIPSPDDDSFPLDMANKCADAFFHSELASKFRLSDNDGNPINNPDLDRLRPIIVHMHLDRPIRHLVQTYSRTVFSRREILACLDRYIVDWKGESATDPGFAPIYNFETEVRVIKLDDYVSIVRFTDEEKNRIMRRLAPLERAFDIRHYASAFQMMRLRPLNSSIDEESIKKIRTNARKALQCAITSLRLMKSEAIGTLGYIHVRELTGDLGAGFSPVEELDLPWNWMSGFRDRYLLDREDLPRFRQIFKMLSDGQYRTWDELQLLLRQFNRSCQRERNEDRILDYSICLEGALLLGIDSELGYRLALRTAKLLGGTREPKTTFRHIQCLYKVRSNIVHSNESLGSPKSRKAIERLGLTPNQFMDTTDSLIREMLLAIIRRVSLGHTLESLCDGLEDDILMSI